MAGSEVRASDGIQYSAPPVAETAIGFEFAPIPIGPVQLIEARLPWAETFPFADTTIAQPPSQPTGLGEALDLGFGTGLPPVRVQLRSQSQDRLIQMQSDRLFLNWQRLEGAAYPNYETLRDEYLGYLAEFSSYLVDRYGFELTPLTAEWTYVNAIDRSDFGDRSVFSVWNETGLDIPGRALINRFQSIRSIESDGFLGEMTLTCEPQGLGDTAPVILTIVTRFFLPSDITVEQAIPLLDSAHEIGRGAFESIVTNDARQKWGPL